MSAEKRLPQPPPTWAEKAFSEYGAVGSIGSGDSYDRAAYSSVYDEVKSELVEMGERGRDMLASYSDRWTQELKNESKVRVGICAALGGGACGSAVAWLVLSSLAPVGAITGAITGAVFALTSDRVRRRSRITKLLCTWSRVCAAAVLALAVRANLTARSALNDVNKKYGTVFASARERTEEIIDSAAIGQQTAAFVQALTDAVHDAKIDEKVRNAAQATNQFVNEVVFGNPKQNEYSSLPSDQSSSGDTNAAGTTTNQPIKLLTSTENKHRVSQATSSSASIRNSQNHPRPSIPQKIKINPQPNKDSIHTQINLGRRIRQTLSSLNPLRLREPTIYYLTPPAQQYNPIFVAAIPALMIIAYDHSDDIARIGTFLVRVLGAAYNGAALEASAAATLFS
eukprot:CAMPEP_0197294762 /NCGR_PEP_ID=MMETSP0890-20130614/33505_1 /TAXON_ID=44058 ORGANISM="Aureoumbra lagunensis, Strain CCMP1510" /NCGR_SAMPLE_ID=MMETSP0890 /ASSEMBLY_ACC=CAM_ASM_000533 /LENGTH=397 /DNA_ID=CAMNT_0042770349 /DNA_START=78 /DNA_END=1271 /DNA_ORIENTATION=-